MKAIKVVALLSCAVLAASSSELIAKKIVVTNSGNSGRGSLRKAIWKANKCDQQSVITFNIPETDRGYKAHTKSWCIQLCKELPAITSEVHIDGYSQHGACPNSLPINKKNTARIAIELCGPGKYHSDSAATGGDLGIRGLTFGPGSEGSSVKGLAINDFSVGIEVASCNVSIGGNFLGVGVNGKTPHPNLVSVYVTKTADEVTIGNGRPDMRNLICGYGRYEVGHESHDKLDILGAITTFGNNTTIQGLTVNLTRCGDALLLEKACVGIVSTWNTGTYIGGPDFCDRVVVAGHKNANILLDSTCKDTLWNVFTGTDITGTYALGGGTGLTYCAHFECADEALHLVKNSVFSGHTGSGVVIGKKGQTISNVTLHKIKAGTDYTGEHALPNEKNGVEIISAVNTKISLSYLKYNGLNGTFLKLGFGTILQSNNTEFNKIGGSRVETIKRPDDIYEIRISGTRVTGNRKLAASTPCGSIEFLPIPKDWTAPE